MRARHGIFELKSYLKLAGYNVILAGFSKEQNKLKNIICDLLKYYYLTYYFFIWLVRYRKYEKALCLFGTFI